MVSCVVTLTLTLSCLYPSFLIIEWFSSDFSTTRTLSSVISLSSCTLSLEHSALLDWCDQTFKISVAIFFLSSLNVFATYSAEYALVVLTFLAPN